MCTYMIVGSSNDGRNEEIDYEKRPDKLHFFFAPGGSVFYQLATILKTGQKFLDERDDGEICWIISNDVR